MGKPENVYGVSLDSAASQYCSESCVICDIPGLLLGIQTHVTVPMLQWTVVLLYLHCVPSTAQTPQRLFASSSRIWVDSYIRIESCQHSSAKWVCDLQTAAEISKSAMDNSDQLAVEAVDLFLALIGAEAGHMGLRSLASGGIYICGGIMPKVTGLSQPCVGSPVLRKEHCVWVH